MPAASKAQFRLMQAAARTPGGFGGVPQKVGKDFAAADKAKGTKYKALPARLGKTASSGKKAKPKHKPRLGFTIDGDEQG